MFKQITIIGFGLIGSSLARVIREKAPQVKIICGDQSKDTCAKAKELKIADAAMSDLGAAVRGSDLVVLCVPVGVMGEVGQEIAGDLAEGAVVTDSGSVKADVIQALTGVLPDHVSLVPAHPIAGTEFSGVEAGFAELFQNRWSIITPLPDTDIRAVEMVTKLWELAGSNIEIMSPAHHDLVLGITSHLPHLIAYTIVGTATDLEDDLRSEVIKFSASGFRDFTRIAASNPTMWRDVFLHNKDAVLEVLGRFSEDLSALQRAIRKQDGDYLYQKFEETRDMRRKIIDAGQAE